MIKPAVKVFVAAAAMIGALPFVNVRPALGDAADARDAVRVAAPAESPSLSVLSPPPSACFLTAQALKQAAIRDAQHEFWIAVAKCRNGDEVGDCIDEAFDELAEGVQLAFEQRDARLELCSLLGGGPYCPDLDPDDFSANVTNTYFPIIPNRILHYAKMTDEGLEEVVITFLPGVVEIDGIPCSAVSAIESLNGDVKEDTIDWYSQHMDGAAWYVGEIAKNFDDEGFLEDIDGSWRHGTDGAKGGIIMLANPMVGDAYRQEFLPGEAEDWARVIAVNQTVTVPAGTFMNCIRTEDGTPIEPGNTECKDYAPGVGLIREVDPANGEMLELTMIIN